MNGPNQAKYIYNDEASSHERLADRITIEILTADGAATAAVNGARPRTGRRAQELDPTAKRKQLLQVAFHLLGVLGRHRTMNEGLQH